MYNFGNISIVDKWQKGYYVVADELEGAFRLSPIPPGTSEHYHHDQEFIDSLMSQVASAKAETQEANAKVAEAEIKAAKAKIEADKFENEVKKLKAQLLEMATERDKLDVLVSELSAQANELSAKMQKLTESTHELLTERNALAQEVEELKRQLHHHPSVFGSPRRRIEAGSLILSGSGIHIASQLSQGILRSIVFAGRKGAATLRWNQGNDMTLGVGVVRGLEKQFPGDVLGDFVLTLTNEDEVEVFWSAEVRL